MSITILTKVNSVSTQVINNEQALTSVLPQSSDDTPDPFRCLSNSKLLLSTLVDFFGQDRSSYLPFATQKAVSEALSNIDDALKLFSATPAEENIEAAKKVIVLLDSFYGLCLQFGIMTFGFSDKIAQENVARISGFVESTRQKSLESQANLTEFFDTTRGGIDSLRGDLESSIKNLNEISQVAKKDAEAVAVSLQSAEKASSEIEKLAGEISAIKVSVDESAKRVPEELQQLKAKSESSLKTLQKNEEESEKLVAGAKASSGMIADTRAGINEQFEAIKQFYGEIEKHRAAMLDVKKDATANINSLQATADKSVEAYTKRSEEIVKANEGLIEQIKLSLQKAVGVSLFTAFDNRRTTLAAGTVLWSKVLCGATVTAIVFAWWFVENLHEIQTPLLLARLTIAIPITFLIIFSAKQYANERRAEEEYAFKSAISVSLESYRDLLERMRRDGMDIDFARTLLLEIFDNPVRRLYSDHIDKKSNRKKAGQKEEQSLIQDLAKKLAGFDKETIEKLLSVIETAEKKLVE